MANTYTQLYIQFVFAVKGRENLIKESFRDELEKVICGIITSKLMEQVKSGSSNWLNEKKIIPGKFSWQEGYGAFTYSRSHIDKVVKYVLNQPEHHNKQSFKNEYLSFLKKFDVDYDPKYLFEYYE